MARPLYLPQSELVLELVNGVDIAHVISVATEPREISTNQTPGPDAYGSRSRGPASCEGSITITIQDHCDI